MEKASGLSDENGHIFKNNFNYRFFLKPKEESLEARITHL